MRGGVGVTGGQDRFINVSAYKFDVPRSLFLTGHDDHFILFAVSTEILYQYKPYSILSFLGCCDFYSLLGIFYKAWCDFTT